MRYFCVDAYACIHTQWEFKLAWNHFGDLLRFDCPLGVYSRFGQQLFKNVKFSLLEKSNSWKWTLKKVGKHIHPSIHPSICLYFGGVQVIVWMRVDDDFDSFLSVVARFFEVKSCFRRYFSNCSDIWLCLNAGDQGTHSNPLVNHHTQISRIGWFDLWNPLKNRRCFFPMIFPWNIMKLIGRPPWRPVGALLLHHRKLVVETWESESRDLHDLHGGHQGPQGPKRGQFKKNYNLVI